MNYLNIVCAHERGLKAREEAVIVLHQAGWSEEQIAYVLRWKISAVKAAILAAYTNVRAAL